MPYFFQLHNTLICIVNLIFHDLLQKHVSAYLQLSFLKVEEGSYPEFRKKYQKTMKFEITFGVLTSLRICAGANMWKIFIVLTFSREKFSSKSYLCLIFLFSNNFLNKYLILILCTPPFCRPKIRQNHTKLERCISNSLRDIVNYYFCSTSAR